MSMFSDMKKAGLKTASKAARAVIKNKFSQPITSTLNDFSMVEKATLRFASTDDYNPTPPIPVQINPNEISYNYESYSTHKNVVTNIQGESRVVESSKDPFLQAKMSFTLNYDFYDAYYARSAGGSGFSLNMLSGEDGFCLTNPKYSSLQTIIDKSCDVSNYVLFKWGPLEHFGQIEAVDPHYTAFSPYGEPLKATASIEMRIYHEQHILKGSHLYKVYTALTKGKLSFSNDDTVNKLANKMHKGLNKSGQLLRDIYPTIKALR